MKIKIAPKGFLKRKVLFVKKLTSSEQRFLSVLEDDDYFENQIFSIRGKFNIPSDGFGLSKFKKTKSKKVIFEAFFDETRKLVKVPYRQSILTESFRLCEEYSLGSTWVFSIHFIIISGYFIPATWIPPVEIIKDKDLTKEFLDKNMAWLHPMKGVVYIKIDHKVSRSKLIRFINEIWNNSIDPYLGKPPGYHPKVMIRSLELYKRIYHLRKRENKKFSDIAELINDEFQKNLDDTDIRKMFERYKKQIDSLRKKRDKKKM